MAKEVWREYVVRKYVRARSAQEAIALAEAEPVIEVNEMQDQPRPSSGDQVQAVGFTVPSSVDF